MAVVCNTHQTALDNDAKLPKDHCQGPLKIPIKVGHRFCPFLALLCGPYTNKMSAANTSTGGRPEGVEI
jgi:hypothetical protein